MRNLMILMLQKVLLKIVNLNISANPPKLKQNEIFISGLPCNMEKPCIYFSRSKGDISKLTGDATITFENEETVERAFNKYNGQRLSNLNGAEIHVKMAEKIDLEHPQVESSFNCDASNLLLQQSGAITTTRVTLATRFVSIVIGAKGSEISKIRQKSGALIQIGSKPLDGTSDQVITITGNPNQIEQAQYLLQQAVRQSKLWNQ